MITAVSLTFIEANKGREYPAIYRQINKLINSAIFWTENWLYSLEARIILGSPMAHKTILKNNKSSLRDLQSKWKSIIESNTI